MKPTVTIATVVLLLQPIAICGVTSVAAKDPVTVPAEVRLTGAWTVSVTVPRPPALWFEPDWNLMP